MTQCNNSFHPPRLGCNELGEKDQEQPQIAALSGSPEDFPDKKRIATLQQKPSFYAFNGRTSNVDYCSAMGFVVKPCLNH